MATKQKALKETVTFLVTIPVELERKIQEAAKREHRKRHAQVVHDLSEKYQDVRASQAGTTS